MTIIDPGAEAVDRLLEDLEECRFKPSEVARSARRLRAHILELRGALEPFGDCVDQIDPGEDDEEWAKFRLLVKDYRRAARALGR